MPELPEVETIKRELEKAVLGKKITRVDISNPKVIRGPSPGDFKKFIEGSVIDKISRKAKVLIIELSNGKSLVIHLKMTGQLVFPGGGDKSRVRFHFSDGQAMDFNDQRLFAELRVLDDWRKLEFIKGLGPEPFDINVVQFKKMLGEKKTKIKPLLMDQSFISGIGNLYAAEILFMSGINPQRRACDLIRQEKEVLFEQIKTVLREAINYGGSSVDNYVRLSGRQGGYVPHLRVYGRQGKPCISCKSAIKRINIGGRGSYYCPKCQK